MARTDVTPQTLALTGVNPTAVTIDATLVTNGVAIKAKGLAHTLVIRVNNTALSEKDVIIRAGASDFPAWMAAKGDVTIAVPTTETRYLGELEGARFNQASGDVWIDFESGFTGTLEVLSVPWHRA